MRREMYAIALANRLSPADIMPTFPTSAITVVSLFYTLSSGCQPLATLLYKTT